MTQSFVPNDGNFRNPQSFTLLGSAHLLEKLRWDLSDLRQAQWDESLDNWRQVVSYKAVNFATTAWHLVEWVDEETRRAIIPRAALASLFGIDLPSDPPTPATSKKKAQDECWGWYGFVDPRFADDPSGRAPAFVVGADFDIEGLDNKVFSRIKFTHAGFNAEALWWRIRFDRSWDDLSRWQQLLAPLRAAMLTDGSG